MDFAQNLDATKLLLTETALSFVMSPFSSPPYNLAIFLFGAYAQENVENAQSLQTFTGLLGVSAIFDIVWMARNHQNVFGRLLTILLLILKIPTFLAVGNSLRQRGSHFGGIGIRGNDLAGPTIWSMPGGFTSENRSAYQPLDEDRPNAPGPIRPPAPPMPQPAASAPAPGAYQTV